MESEQYKFIYSLSLVFEVIRLMFNIRRIKKELSKCKTLKQHIRLPPASTSRLIDPSTSQAADSIDKATATGTKHKALEEADPELQTTTPTPRPPNSLEADVSSDGTSRKTRCSIFFST
ncbi:hypothetical protein ElyMa_001247900 [Elysia marginata]|uniref:Uncharacterized protein n=1 Tax=Elysia marginata TaxID=1093978 RepID=A0AAV4IAS5_9GAST|nr:hypothetical protein ElyMa_001247900 [Elysia marginata]